MQSRIEQLARRVLDGERLSRQELLDLPGLGRQRPTELFYWAWQIRQAHFGNKVWLCSIVPGKLGGCSEDCRWCAQSSRTTTGLTTPKRLGLDQIVAAAHDAVDSGAECFGIVNSGRRPSRRDLDELVAACRAVRSEPKCSSLGLCASLGELSCDQVEKLIQAGITRYNHNLETSRRFFPNVVTTHAYDDRMRTLQAARDAGLELCSGGLFGLGETWADRVDLALEIRDTVKSHVVPLNFLDPIPGTPLGHLTPPGPLEILTVIAVFRFALPHVRLKIGGGREVNLRSMQQWIFHAGATGCIIGNYLTTTGRAAEDDLRMLEQLGLEPVGGHVPASHE